MWTLLVPLVASLLISGLFGHSVPGGEHPVDVKDEGVQKSLKFAMVQFNQKNTDKYLWQVEKALSATEQVVAGVSYTIKVKVFMTACKKSTTTGTCSIPPNFNSPRLTCTFAVWDKPWENPPMEVTSQKCQ